MLSINYRGFFRIPSRTREDFLSCGSKMDISERRIKDMVSDVVAAARKWNQYAESVQLNEQQMEYIKSFLRYDM